MSETIPVLKPKQNRESDSGESSSIAKKPKTEQSRNAEVDSSERNKGREVNEPNSDVREMGFEIEADAAEDKGLRHNMEDTWVVLLDASSDFQEKLRFLMLCFAYYALTIRFSLVLLGLIA